MSRPRIGGALLLLGLAGCWADFPESRFHDGATADFPPVVDTFVSPDGPSPPAELGPDTLAPGEGGVDLAGDAAPDTLAIDGPMPDTGPCPAACSSCSGGVCTLPCATGCTCPAGWSCNISCGGGGCQGNIDCSGAQNCTVDCPKNACTGNITCGSGACTVSCDDASCLGNITCGAGMCSVSCSKKSCTGDISCAASCGCSVSCAATSCSGTTTCPPACSGQCDPQDGCDNC